MLQDCTRYGRRTPLPDGRAMFSGIVAGRRVPFSTALSGFGAAPTSGIALPDSDVAFTTGSRSVYVAQVQSILKANGYDPGLVDGVVGPRTIAALEAAINRLAISMSPDARNTIAAAGSTAAGLAEALTAAFGYDAELRQSPGSPVPTAPEQNIAMGPDEAAKMAGRLGLGVSTGFPWKWVGIGAAVLAMGAAAVWFARR